MAGRKPTTPLIRFEEKFEKKTPLECWEWKAALAGPAGNQYGHFRLRKNLTRAHRVAWTLYIGEVPPNMHVLHKCDNPLCVNPSHLFLGNAKDNSDDCHAKGRGPIGTRFKPRIPDEVVSEIRNSYKPREVGYLKLAKRFGISAGHVRQLVKGSRR